MASSVGIGEVMRGATVGEVLESRRPDLEPGDLVTGLLGWQEYAATAAVGKIPAGADATMTLSVLGATGLTAYFGLLDVGRPKAGDTVVVSGAAGATGSIAGQIAKLKGCRVVGLAGGAVAMMTDAGFGAVTQHPMTFGVCVGYLGKA